MSQGRSKVRKGNRRGVGSVEALPSGRFRVRVRVKGKKTGDTFATREEAERQRALIAVRYRAAAEGAPKKPEVLTLAAWAETWLARRIELKDVRAPQRDAVRWARYIATTPLNAMPLVDIRAKHVAEWVDGMRRRPMARGPGRLMAATIRRTFVLLRLAMADAVRAEHIPANPCVSARLPRIRESAWAFLSVEEIDRVHVGAPGCPEEARRVFQFAIYTGLRQGEILALRWGDVTLTGAVLEVHVQRSHDGPTKSGKSRRVPLLPRALDALQGQLAHATEAGDPTGPDDLVWPSPWGFQRRPNDDFGWSTRRRRPGLPNGLREALGIARKVKFHELRHTCASHLVMGTWTKTPLEIAAVQAFLGHANIATTMRYAHLAPGFLHDRVRGTGGSGGGSGDSGVGRGTTALVPRSSENATKQAESARVNRPPSRASEMLESKAFSASVGQTWDNGALRGTALDLLRAVDEGTPAGDLARALALDVLRVAAPDSPTWHRAVAVLEGGPLRMRHAVELAGLVMDATEERVAAHG